MAWQARKNRVNAGDPRPSRILKSSASPGEQTTVIHTRKCRTLVSV